MSYFMYLAGYLVSISAAHLIHIEAIMHQNNSTPHFKLGSLAQFSAQNATFNVNCSLACR